MGVMFRDLRYETSPIPELRSIWGVLIVPAESIISREACACSSAPKVPFSLQERTVKSGDANPTE